MKYKTLQTKFPDNADPEGVCWVAAAVQGKRLHRFLYLMHHIIINSKEKNIQNKDINLKKYIMT